MKKMIALACLGFSITLSASAFAGAQQGKMKGCNMEAAGMKGDERKAFMKKCLSKDYVLKSGAATPATPATPAAASAQQGKMKACNVEAKAKDLKGDDRKKFMSTCLKG